MQAFLSISFDNLNHAYIFFQLRFLSSLLYPTFLFHSCPLHQYNPLSRFMAYSFVL